MEPLTDVPQTLIHCQLQDIDDRRGVLELCPELCHLQGLLLIGREIESASEILVRLRTGEVDADC